MADGTWSAAEAKAKFSEVVERALTDGPQKVTRNGRPVAVVVSEKEWEAALGRPLGQVLFDPAVRGILSVEEAETLFERDRDAGRPIKL